MNKEYCKWCEEDGGEYYNTSCDNAFIFNDGDPLDNNFKFCPFCGKLIKC